MAANPWDQREGEPNNWYSRFFDYYLPLGANRSLEQAFRNWRANAAPESAGKRPNPTWYRSFSQWQWADRAHAWDVAQSTKALAKVENEIADMKTRHIRGAVLLQRAAMKRLETLAKHPESLTPSETLRLFKEAAELERQARGLPKEILEVWQLTNEQIVEKYRQLIAGITATDGLGSGDETEGDTYSPDGGDS